MPPIPPEVTSEMKLVARPPAARSAGWGLIVLGVLSVVFMTMHPTAGTHDPGEFIVRVGRGVPGNTFVHGSLIAVVLCMMGCFLWLTDVLGPMRLLVRAGLVAQVAGTAGAVAAGLLNGFIVPAFAARALSAGTVDVAAVAPALSLARAMNATFARFGMVGVSLAAVAWSIALLAAGGWKRWVGVAGLACGLAPLALHAAEHLHMDVAGSGRFVQIHAVWAALAGIVIVRSARDAGPAHIDA